MINKLIILAIVVTGVCISCHFILKMNHKQKIVSEEVIKCDCGSWPDPYWTKEDWKLKMEAMKKLQATNKE